MHAYLIVGDGTLEVENLIKKLKAQRIDFILEKIADVRELTKFTKLKVTTKTAIVIDNFNLASEEAQNAFLKSIEEPQENLIFILAASNTENILPTIISRCQVIEVPYKNLKVSEEIKKEVEEFLSLDTKAKLLKVSKIKDRQQALEFLNNLIIGAEKTPQNLLILDKALETIRALKLNGNVSLQLTNFVLQSEAD